MRSAQFHPVLSNAYSSPRYSLLISYADVKTGIIAVPVSVSCKITGLVLVSM